MSEQRVNVPLLRKAIEWAEAEAAKPEQKDAAWYQLGVVTEAEEIGRSCGTCYCIAGYVALVVGGPEALAGNEIDFAMEALGLTDETLNDLFQGRNTIEDVRRIAEDIAGERL